MSGFSCLISDAELPGLHVSVSGVDIGLMDMRILAKLANENVTCFGFLLTAGMSTKTWLGSTWVISID